MGSQKKKIRDTLKSSKKKKKGWTSKIHKMGPTKYRKQGEDKITSKRSWNKQERF